MIRIVACPHPFTSERIERELPHGSTYRDILKTVQPIEALQNAAILDGAEPVPVARWDNMPEDGATVIVRVVPTGSPEEARRGGQIGAKAGLWTGIAGFLVMLIPGAQILGAVMMGVGAAGILVGGGIATGAQGLMGSPAKSRKTEDLPSLRGARNRMAAGAPVPLIFGKHLCTPYYLATPRTEIVGADGEDQYLRMIFLVGYAPLRISQIKIGETLLATNSADVRNGSIAIDGGFSGVELEIREDAAASTLYPKLCTEDQLSIALKSSAAATDNIRATPKKTTRVEVDIAFPSGLVTYSSDNPTTAAVRVVPYYRAKGATAWTAMPAWSGVGDYTISRAKAKTLRYSSGLDVSAGEYEVRVVRETADTTDSKIRDDCTWYALRSFRDVDPVDASARAKVVRLAIKIKASDQLSGVIDQLNLVAEAVLPAYGGSGTGPSAWTPQVTTSPAAAFLAALRGPANPRPVPDDRIDWSVLEAWSTWAAQRGFECSGVVVGSEPMRKLLARIGATARASTTLRDGLYSVVVDQPKSVPVQAFTPRNSRNFIGTKAFVDRPHALKVKFVNAAEGYAADECIVYDDGYTKATATKFEPIELWGVTAYDQAWKHGRYLLAVMRLRPEAFQVEVDIEHIVCQRGDLVLVSHDVPLWGLKQGRIKSTSADASGAVISFAVDEPCPMEAGKTYGVRIRLADGRFIQRAVTTTAGEQTTLSLASSITAADAPGADDLFVFGESGIEAIECIVVGIEPVDDLSARLTLVEAAPGVHQADTGAIPAFESKIGPSSGLSLPAVIDGANKQPGAADTQLPATNAALEHYIKNLPPEFNVADLQLFAEPNPDGTVDVSLSWRHDAGKVPADGFLVFYKKSIEAPSAIDMQNDQSKFVAAGTANAYSTQLNLPTRQMGVGAIPIHYRFGVVAIGLRQRGTVAHPSGVVENGEWIDRCFAAVISIDEENSWDQYTGEFKAGAGNGRLHVDPARGRVSTKQLYSDQFRSDQSLLLYAGGYAALAAEKRVIGRQAPAGSRLWLLEESLADTTGLDDWATKSGLDYATRCKYGEHSVTAAAADTPGVLKLAKKVDLRGAWSLEWFHYAARDRLGGQRTLTIADGRGNEIRIDIGLESPTRGGFAVDFAAGFFTDQPHTNDRNLRVSVFGEGKHLREARLPLKYFRYLALVEEPDLSLRIHVDNETLTIPGTGWLNPGLADIEWRLKGSIEESMDAVMLLPGVAQTAAQCAASRDSDWGYGQIPVDDQLVLWAPGMTEMNLIRAKRGRAPGGELDTGGAAAGQVYNALAASLDVVGRSVLVHGVAANNVAWKATRINASTIRIYHAGGSFDVTAASSGGVYRMAW